MSILKFLIKYNLFGFEQICGKLRDALINKKITIKKGESYTLKEDYVFTSPSTAAAVVSGSMANGWIEWKNKSGKTLDECFRKGRKSEKK